MRAGDGREIETDAYHHLHLATDLLNKRFVPMLAYPRARSMEELGDWVRHPGEEYTYIIEGTVDLYSELYAPVRLEKGDSIYFDSGMGHTYIAVGDAPCQALTICSGDESQLISAVEKAGESQKPPTSGEACTTRGHPREGPASGLDGAVQLVEQLGELEPERAP